MIEAKKNWMTPDKNIESGIIFFRNIFSVKKTTVLEFDYSMDEYGAVFLDGELLEYGSERSCASHWYCNHVKCDLDAGEHELIFRVLFLDQELRPWAWMSVAHGLYFNETTGLLNNNSWQWRQLDCQLFLPQPDWGQAPRVHINRTETANSPKTWCGVVWRSDERELFPAVLKSMRKEAITDFCREDSVSRTVITLPFYSCVTVDYLFSGSGSVDIRYYESPDLVSQPLNLAEPGVVYDHIELTGETYRWFDLWFRAGKVVEFCFNGTVKLEKVNFFRTGYPWVFDRMSRQPEDRRLEQLFTKAIRTLECCSMHTYMDCPFYERMQYVADSRIQMLTCYQISSDRSLPRKALFTMGQAMRRDGALECRYPAKDEKMFHIFEPTEKCNPMLPGFSILYIQMLHDYAQLREDDELVRELLPVARRIVSWASGFLKNNILKDLPGWNFLDWLPEWNNGIPPGCVGGCGCTLNWIFVRSLLDLADLERVFGTPGRELAYREMAAEITEAVIHAFFVPERGLFAENEQLDYFSEHAQVWALLAADRREVLPGLLAGDLDQCGIAFSFYYMAICRLYSCEEAFAKRLEYYLTMAEDPRLDTLPEEFVNWRSWCHAWSSHSLYFYYAPRVGILDPIRTL